MIFNKYLYYEDINVNKIKEINIMLNMRLESDI